jgi:plasmid stability protein
VSARLEARRRCASEWQPHGNHLCPTRGIQGVQECVLSENKMGLILLRGLDQKTIELLKERARLNGRSLQEEAKALLERAAETLTTREARRLSERWRHRLGGGSISDSAQLIREDRDSR